MINKKDCCGCTACAHICPVKCIEMKEDKEGFLYPAVDNEKCIHCHKCERVCPIGSLINYNNETKTFIGYNKNEEIREKFCSYKNCSAVDPTKIDIIQFVASLI